MNKTMYSEGFKEQALSKALQRGDRTIHSVAEELNVSYFTLKGWMKRKSQEGRAGGVAREKRPQDWSLAERLAALQESHGLEGEALSSWCRGKGLFVHHLVQWKAEFCQRDGDSGAGRAEMRALKEANQRLQRELSRKEKALAEAAALMMLQKKYQALLGGEAE
jgi:transposase-like protein